MTGLNPHPLRAVPPEHHLKCQSLSINATAADRYRNLVSINTAEHRGSALPKRLFDEQRKKQSGHEQKKSLRPGYTSSLYLRR